MSYARRAGKLFISMMLDEMAIAKVNILITGRLYCTVHPDSGNSWYSTFFSSWEYILLRWKYLENQS